ncbi:MAG: hypothetical protein ACRDLA_13360, partial [Thermoleophilaceae bacterium]
PSIDDFKQAFVVTEAELTAIPSQRTTTCPTTVRFEGRIHVNGSGQIRYRVEENGQVVSVGYKLDITNGLELDTLASRAGRGDGSSQSFVSG